MIAGCYSLDLYCENNSDKHPFGNYKNFTGETGGEARREARASGWKIDMRNFTATCPLCNKEKFVAVSTSEEIIASGDWWCVVDFDDSIEPSSITVRSGKKESVKGQDVVIRSHELDGDVASKVWGKFNEIQLTPKPETLLLLINRLQGQP